MFDITRFVVNPFEENTYLLVDRSTSEAIVVDPGMNVPEEEKAFDDFISRNKIKLTGIILTHAHLDHCFGIPHVRNKFRIEVRGNFRDADLAAGVAAQAARFGMQNAFDSPVKIDIDLKDGDVVKVGDSSLRVIAVPGHSRGGISLYCPEQDFVITGDSLFEGAIGRTDLPGGDYATLVSSVKNGLMSLPDKTTVLPGHGPSTTIAAEKNYNPYL